MVTKVSKATLLISAPLGRKNGSETTEKNMGAGENGSRALLSPFSLCFFVASAWKMGKGYAFCAFSLFSDVSACRKWENVSLVRFL